MGFWNVRGYVFFQDNPTWQRCKGKTKDKILSAHRIENRKTGGNSPAHLMTLFESRHHEIHQKRLEHTMKRKNKTLRDASQMIVLY